MACERLPGETILEWDRRCQQHEQEGGGQLYPVPREMPGPKQPIALPGSMQSALRVLEELGYEMTPATNRAGGPAVVASAPRDYRPRGDAAVERGIDDALGRFLFAPEDLSEADVRLLLRANEISTADVRRLMEGSGGGGDGVGWANLAQRQAEFEYQREQDALARAREERMDRVALAMEEIDALANQQAVEEARREAMQAARLEAQQYAIAPGVTHVPGFGPGSVAVRLGLTDPIEVTPVAFDPNAAGRGSRYDEQLRERIAQLAGMMA